MWETVSEGAGSGGLSQRHSSLEPGNGPVHAPPPYRRNLSPLSSAGHQGFLWGFSNGWSLGISYPTSLSVFGATCKWCTGASPTTGSSWQESMWASLPKLLSVMSHGYFKSALLAVFTPRKKQMLNARSPFYPSHLSHVHIYQDTMNMWHSHTYSTVRSMHPGISWKFILSPEWFQVSSAIRSESSPRVLEVDPATINQPL